MVSQSNGNWHLQDRNVAGVSVEEASENEAESEVDPLVSDDEEGGVEDASEGSDEPLEAPGDALADLKVEASLGMNALPL